MILEMIKCCNIGVVYTYAVNIPIDRRHLWQTMIDFPPKDCEWIIKKNFNVTEKPEDKNIESGRAINDLERYTWKGFLTSNSRTYLFIKMDPNSHGTNGQV